MDYDIKQKLLHVLISFRQCSSEEYLTYISGDTIQLFYIDKTAFGKF